MPKYALEAAKTIICTDSNLYGCVQCGFHDPGIFGFGHAVELARHLLQAMPVEKGAASQLGYNAENWDAGVLEH